MGQVNIVGVVISQLDKLKVAKDILAQCRRT